MRAAAAETRERVCSGVGEWGWTYTAPHRKVLDGAADTVFAQRVPANVLSLPPAVAFDCKRCCLCLPLPSPPAARLDERLPGKGRGFGGYGRGRPAGAYCVGTAYVQADRQV